jgi:hypothetical protein
VADRLWGHDGFPGGTWKNKVCLIIRRTSRSTGGRNGLRPITVQCSQSVDTREVKQAKALWHRFTVGVTKSRLTMWQGGSNTITVLELAAWSFTGHLARNSPLGILLTDSFCPKHNFSSVKVSSSLPSNSCFCQTWPYLTGAGFLYLQTENFLNHIHWNSPGV